MSKIEKNSDSNQTHGALLCPKCFDEHYTVFLKLYGFGTLTCPRCHHLVITNEEANTVKREFKIRECPECRSKSNWVMMKWAANGKKTLKCPKCGHTIKRK